CPAAFPFCRLKNVTFGIFASGANCENEIDRSASFLLVELPAHTKPTFMRPVQRLIFFRHCFLRIGSIERYGRFAGIDSTRVAIASGRLIIGGCTSKGGKGSPVTTWAIPATLFISRANSGGHWTITRPPRQAT